MCVDAAAACGVGDGGSEEKSGSEEERSPCRCAVAKARRIDGGTDGGGGKGSELT
jgi:hypothetical protein